MELKTEAEVEAMAAAGAVVAEALRAVAEQARPGQSTTQLDKVAADVLAGHGARSPFLNYHPAWAPRPFPGVLCVSVNDAVVHGIPNGQVLADGDLVSIDFGATLRGWCGDAARSFIVGTPRPEDASLIAATDNALAAGIPRRGPATRWATSVTRSHRPHDAQGSARAERRAGGQGHAAATRSGDRDRTDAHRRGTDDYVHDSDGWTLRTASGARPAHSEHTVAVTRDSARILTH